MFSRYFLVIAGLALGATACESPAGEPGDLPPRDQCAIAVVHSDYRSSAISLLTADARPCAPDIIDSGSRPPGLLTALSGDVVLTSGFHAPATSDQGLAPRVALIDRYPAGTLTLVDPLSDAVTHQLALSPGFSGNPQDILALSGDTLLVSRLEAAPLGATPEPAGSDLALFRLAPDAGKTVSGQLIGRMDLSAMAEPGFVPMPARIVRLGSRLFFGLAHLAPDFSAAGPGRVAYVEAPADLAVPALAAWLADTQPTVITLPDLENCTELAASPEGEGVWIVCSGSFRRGARGQSARSGIAFINKNGILEAIFRADAVTAAVGEAAPLGFTLAAVDAHRVVVVALGDIVTKRGDRALLVTRPQDQGGIATTASQVQILHETGPHDLGEALKLVGHPTVLLADGNPRNPQILAVSLPSPDQAMPTVRAIPVASQTGLPPRSLRYFRRP